MGRVSKLIIFYLACIFAFSASASTMQKTKAELASLKAKITTLNQKLFHAESEQTSLEKKLAQTDKKIGVIVHQLNLVARVMHKKARKIEKLTQAMQVLQAAKQKSQDLLAEEIRLYYLFERRQLSQNIWLAQSPGALNRFMTQHQHLAGARAALIEDIASKEALCAEKERGLQEELAGQAHLKQSLEQEKRTLEKAQSEQDRIVAQLKVAIHSDKQKLTDYEHNEQALQRLLETLLSQETTPFPQQATQHKRVVKIEGVRKQGAVWHQGLIFKAEAGSHVYAAERGKVVFSDWLRGYGLLMIIDHGKGWMSLYGYNQSLFKHRGQWVEKGEQIATVGSSGGQEGSSLYFEVRHFGKVVRAQPWLAHRNSPIFIT